MSEKPYEGMMVIDLTTTIAGPYCTRLLADLGADVIKIEAPDGDMMRSRPPAPDGHSRVFGQLNAGKRSVVLDLKRSEDAQAVRELAARADLLVENFRPGVTARLGLDYPRLAQINPRLIYCSISGYGQTGPLRDRAGHDMNYMALSGVMGYSGRKVTGPTLMGIQIADIASGSNNAVIGILAAVVSRAENGEGQYIDISMTDGVMALNAMAGAAYLAGGESPGREENWLNGGSLYDFYETKDGGYLSIGSLEPQFFKTLCEVISRPDLVSGGVMPKPQDFERVREEIRAIVRTRTRAEWEAIFLKVDACVEPVLSLAEALEGELARGREMVVDVPLRAAAGSGDVFQGSDSDPTTGTGTDVPCTKVRQLANPVKFSSTPVFYGFAGVKTGTHNREVLMSLDYTEAQIAEFAATGLFD